jgi:hypothetical protein
MATFYAVRCTDFPNGWEESPISSDNFLRAIQPHAVQVTFDLKGEEAAELFSTDWMDGQYPSLLRNWAEGQGVKVENFLFIFSERDEGGIGDFYPDSTREIWGTWPALDNYSVDVSALQWQVSDLMRQVENIRQTIAAAR